MGASRKTRRSPRKENAITPVRLLRLTSLRVLRRVVGAMVVEEMLDDGSVVPALRSRVAGDGLAEISALLFGSLVDGFRAGEA